MKYPQQHTNGPWAHQQFCPSGSPEEPGTGTSALSTQYWAPKHGTTPLTRDLEYLGKSQTNPQRQGDSVGRSAEEVAAFGLKAVIPRADSHTFSACWSQTQ